MSEEQGIRVTVEDTVTGESDTAVIWDDYIVTTAGGCYVDHIQTFANGTHVVTIKGRIDAKAKERR